MKILIFRLGAIGDVVQTCIAIQAYRQQYDKCEITFVVNERIAPLVQLLNVANHIVGVDEQKLVFGSAVSRCKALLILAIRFILLGKFDRVVIPYYNWRYRALACFIRNRGKTSYRLHGARPAPINERSRVYEVWRLITGTETSDPFNISDALTALGRNIFQAPTPGILQQLPESYVVLVPGGARNLHSTDSLRRWPLENYVKVARALAENGMEVVLAGAGWDDWASPGFSDVRHINLIGKTSLIEMSHLMVRASLVIAHDCGPLHLATLGQAKIIAIFGPTPLNAFAPLSRQQLVAISPGNRIACSPCYNGRSYAACTRAVCMEHTTAGSVIDLALAHPGRGLQV